MKQSKFIKQDEKVNIFYILPILSIVSLVPLIVKLKIVNIKESVFINYYASTLGDFFSYYKMIWISAIALIGVVIVIYGLYNHKLKIDKFHYYIPMGIYAVFIVLSSVLSKYNSISFYGIVGRYEGMFVLLSYIFLMFITMNLVKDKRYIRHVLWALIISASIIGIIGVFQYFKFDLFKTDIIREIISPNNETATVQLETGTIYSTLAHYNYVGSYMAMLFPLSFVLFLNAKEKSFKIVMGLFSSLMLINLVASRSRAGIVGSVIALLIIVIMYRKFVFKKWVYFLGGLTIAAIIIVGLDKVSTGRISSRVNSLINDIESIGAVKETAQFKDIIIEGNSVTILFSDEKLVIKSDDGVSLKDKNGKDIPVNFNKGKIQFKDERFKDFTISLTRLNDMNVLNVEKNELGNSRVLKMNFALTKDGFKFLDTKGNPVDIKPVEKWGFEGNEQLGSARGYIWSRSIPLLKSTVLLGYGPDTFAMYFPQNDYFGKIISYGTANMFVDKPHNLYLNIAISTGVISLIAVLIIFLMYIVSSFKIYLKSDFSDMYSYVGLAVFTAVCGYLVTGFFNDSVVSVAPVFWVLLGMGISINSRLKSKSSHNAVIDSSKGN